MIPELDRPVEERASAKRRAKHYIEDRRMSLWASIVRGITIVVFLGFLGYALGCYAVGVIERDNVNYKKEKGQQPIFEADRPMIEHDRSIKAYDDMKARYGLK